MLLAIDTSTHYASVALHDGTHLVSEHTWLAKQDHTRTLMPALQRLLADAGIDISALQAVAVALGPGSFNGLRVGLSTAKGLAVARSLPMVGASTLEILAAEYSLHEVTMTAGRSQIYRWKPGSDVEIVDGSAPDRIRHAGVLAQLGWERLQSRQTLDPVKIEPLYVRPPHITESHKKAHMQAA
jgi:tRNA A37 threonylcarbamoyladenosine modification protein TsaB